MGMAHPQTPPLGAPTLRASIGAFDPSIVSPKNDWIDPTA